ncbi:MAG: hypothetical protein IT183_07710 [Acidobacteria bacterium]|nr:hypothetical protein [Acidobacteriota bacterium]
MPRILTCSIFAGILALATIRPTAAPDPARAEIARRVFFSATDARGLPVTDLTAADLTIREGGRERAVATLGPAPGTLQISILVDDAGQGFFEGPVGYFVGRMAARAEIAISMLNPQPYTLVDFTTDPPTLLAAVRKLTQRGRIQQDGQQVAEAVAWAARELRKREARRPVILVMTATGESGTLEVDDFILRDLKASGASLHVVHVNGVDLGMVLSEGPMYSGGILANAANTESMRDALSRIAAGLQTQYELTYMLPDGTRPSDRLQLQTTRTGVRLLAPQRIDDN